MASTLIFELLAGLLHFALAIAATVHILLKKDDVRAAIGWTGLVWLAPFFGPLLYLLFGINRIRRAAGRIRQSHDDGHHRLANRRGGARSRPAGR